MIRKIEPFTSQRADRARSRPQEYGGEPNRLGGAVLDGTLPRQNVSYYGEHRAIYVTKGDYIVWIDEGVLVDAGLLTAYLEAFRRWHEAAVFGGRIKPRYESPVETWLI